MILRRRHGYPWYLTLGMIALVLGLFAFLEYHLLNIVHAAEERQFSTVDLLVSTNVSSNFASITLRIVDADDECPKGYVPGRTGRWIEIPSEASQSEFGMEGPVLRLCAHDVYDPMQFNRYSGGCKTCLWATP